MGCMNVLSTTTYSTLRLDCSYYSTMVQYVLESILCLVHCQLEKASTTSTYPSDSFLPQKCRNDEDVFSFPSQGMRELHYMYFLFLPQKCRNDEDVFSFPSQAMRERAINVFSLFDQFTYNLQSYSMITAMDDDSCLLSRTFCPLYVDYCNICPRQSKL
jgi:hypothetical protein